MTKTELIKAVAERADVTQERARTIVNGFFESMKHALLEDDRIELRGFGSFEVREYDAHEAVDPRTGEEIEVGPRKSVHFRVGKDLRQRVDFDENNKDES